MIKHNTDIFLRIATNKNSQILLVLLFFLGLSSNMECISCPLKRVSKESILILHSKLLPERSFKVVFGQAYKVKYDYVGEHCDKVKPFIVIVLTANFDSLNVTILRNQVNVIANTVDVTCNSLSFRLNYPLIQDEINLLENTLETPFYQCKGQINKYGVVKGDCTLLAGSLNTPIDERFPFVLNPVSNIRIKINPKPIVAGQCVD